ncbi:hypothetical protein ACWCPF_32880 [Streptomyces sp. NPDC001858]
MESAAGFVFAQVSSSVESLLRRRESVSLSVPAHVGAMSSKHFLFQG